MKSLYFGSSTIYTSCKAKLPKVSMSSFEELYCWRPARRWRVCDRDPVIMVITLISPSRNDARQPSIII